MSSIQIPIKTYLGKYYSELLYSASQDKYKNTGLDEFFEQRFYIQNNKVQMIVDPGLSGLIAIVTGNEIHISKDLYDHPNVNIINSLEVEQTKNPRSLYNPETFSTLAYLICQNHTTIQVVGDLDEPIYIRYKSDYETFYNSVIIFDISSNISVEVVEEVESVSALNIVSNFLLYSNSKLNLSTFYKNHLSGISFCYRNIIAQESSSFNHILFGKGSSNVIDETKIHTYDNSSAELLGLINGSGKNFHSILYVDPVSPNYKIAVNYKDILSGKSNVSYFPVVLGNTIGNSSTIEVSNITVEELPKDSKDLEIKNFVSDIVDRATLERMVGVKRFYDNKSKFLHFP